MCHLAWPLCRGTHHVTLFLGLSYKESWDSPGPWCGLIDPTVSGLVPVGFTGIGPTLEKGLSMPQTHVFFGPCDLLDGHSCDPM